VAGVKPELLQNQAAEVHCFQAVDTFGKEIDIYA
jgi:hypothetical protein